MLVEAALRSGDIPAARSASAQLLSAGRRPHADRFGARPLGALLAIAAAGAGCTSACRSGVRPAAEAGLCCIPEPGRRPADAIRIAAPAATLPVNAGNAEANAVLGRSLSRSGNLAAAKIAAGRGDRVRSRQRDRASRPCRTGAADRPCRRRSHRCPEAGHGSPNSAPRPAAARALLHCGRETGLGRANAVDGVPGHPGDEQIYAALAATRKGDADGTVELQEEFARQRDAATQPGADCNADGRFQPSFRLQRGTIPTICQPQAIADARPLRAGCASRPTSSARCSSSPTSSASSSARRSRSRLIPRFADSAFVVPVHITAFILMLGSFLLIRIVAAGLSPQPARPARQQRHDVRCGDQQPDRVGADLAGRAGRGLFARHFAPVPAQRRPLPVGLAPDSPPDDHAARGARADRAAHCLLRRRSGFGCADPAVARFTQFPASAVRRHRRRPGATERDRRTCRCSATCRVYASWRARARSTRC